jgi:amidophosphoribosyltransferase
MDLSTRRTIREIEGDNADISAYRNQDGPQYREMVGRIQQRLGLSSLAYQRLDDLVQAIQIPKNQLCTYCFTGEDLAKPNGCQQGCSRCATPCKPAVAPARG